MPEIKTCKNDRLAWKLKTEENCKIQDYHSFACIEVIVIIVWFSTILGQAPRNDIYQDTWIHLGPPAQRGNNCWAKNTIDISILIKMCAQVSL